MSERLGKAARAVKDFFDWRFVVCLSVLMLTLTLFYGSIKNSDQRDKLITAAQRSSERVSQLEELLREQDRLAADRAAADDQQIDQLRQQLRTQNQGIHLIALYLREQGLDLPPSLVKSLNTSSGGGGGADPKGSTPGTQGHPSKPPHPPKPRKPRPTPKASTSTPRPSTGDPTTELLCTVFPVPLICD